MSRELTRVGIATVLAAIFLCVVCAAFTSFSVFTVPYPVRDVIVAPVGSDPKVCMAFRIAPVKVEYTVSGGPTEVIDNPGSCFVVQPSDPSSEGDWGVRLTVHGETGQSTYDIVLSMYVNLNRTTIELVEQEPVTPSRKKSHDNIKMIKAATRGLDPTGQGEGHAQSSASSERDADDALRAEIGRAFILTGESDQDKSPPSLGYRVKNRFADGLYVVISVTLRSFARTPMVEHETPGGLQLGLLGNFAVNLGHGGLSKMSLTHGTDLVPLEPPGEKQTEKRGPKTLDIIKPPVPGDSFEIRLVQKSTSVSIFIQDKLDGWISLAAKPEEEIGFRTIQDIQAKEAKSLGVLYVRTYGPMIEVHSVKVHSLVALKALDIKAYREISAL